MDIKPISPFLAVAPQISEGDPGTLASLGYRTVVNNRPDGEAEGQPTSAAIEAAARRHGLDYHYLPVRSGAVTDDDVAAFAALLQQVDGPVLAFCRTGTRSLTLWALAEARHLSVDAILATAAGAGYDLQGLRERLQAAASRERAAGQPPAGQPGRVHDVVVVGGGAGGLATAASLKRRRPDLDVVVVEPAEHHYYQPGWTLVGSGVFRRGDTVRPMADVIPKGVKWLRAAVAGFEPEQNRLVLEDGERLGYRALVVAPGIELLWSRIEGLSETLGRNGVTSNYRFDLAPYTWELVQSLKSGRAVFTQPPMPIKCAGAPQKAMYLACDHWRRTGPLADIDVAFYNAGAVLFGVADYVPALERYVQRYGANLHFQHNLKAVDGPGHRAWFDVATAGGPTREVEVGFDMIHVVPPQGAPAFVRGSPLADAAGWVEVSHETLRHVRYGNVFGVGDACSAPNAKTAAAVRKQAPVVAENLLAVLDGRAPRAVYDGYGSCPLTVERGRVVLAEFGYGGKLLPTFPKVLLDGTRPTRMAWFLKEKLMPLIYFDLMLKGREWLVATRHLDHEPTRQEAPPAARR